MNIWGKVFLGATIILAAVDVFLATILMGHQSHWQEQIQAKEDQLDGLLPQVAENKNKRNALQLDLNRIENTWGQFITATGGVANANAGEFRINAGDATGLPVPLQDAAPPHVHLFPLEGDGSLTYLGDFTLVDVQRDASTARLTRPPLGGESLQWPANVSVRVRETVPSAWRSLMNNLYKDYAVAEQRLDTQVHQLRFDEAELVKSQDILDQRFAELNGDPEPPEGASQEVIDGLVLTIRQEETLRDAENQVLNDLRHDFVRKVNELNTMLDGNQTKVRALPNYEKSLVKPSPRAPEPLAKSGGE